MFFSVRIPGNDILRGIEASVFNVGCNMCWVLGFLTFMEVWLYEGGVRMTNCKEKEVVFPKHLPQDGHCAKQLTCTL